MARLFSTKPALTFTGRAFLGIRGWSGKPTHPPLTDFPIAAYVLAAVFDVISFAAKGSHPGAARDAFVAATYVMIAGGIVSLGAALTGFWDWWKSIERRPDTGPIGKSGAHAGLADRELARDRHGHGHRDRGGEHHPATGAVRRRAWPASRSCCCRWWPPSW